MDLEFTPRTSAFRDEVRAFVAPTSPPISAESARRQAPRARRLHRAGTASSPSRAGSRPAGPAEYGGPGWTPVQQHIFDEECAAAGAPAHPALRREDGGARDHGASATRRRSSTSCRASSRAKTGGARATRSRAPGSDLASLKTRAVAARGRPLRRQRPEDLDHARPVRRLDLLPRAHRHRRPAAGRHLVPARST